MTTNNDAPSWRVTGVTDVTIYNPQMGAVHGKRVSFVFWDGTASYVDVPLTDYNADAVRDRVQAAADSHVAVVGLTGPSVADAQGYGTGRISNLNT